MNTSHFIGIDPGHKGAIAMLNAAGTTCKIWQMPLNGSELNLSELARLFKDFSKLPAVLIGIEWPTAFPGSFANVTRDAEIFGQQKGVLEAMAFCHRLTYQRITPQLWKNRLGLEGKLKDKGSKFALQKWQQLYPKFQSICLGPKGGLRDGLLDACLIAHLMRTGLNEARYSAFAAYGKSLRNLTPPES